MSKYTVIFHTPVVIAKLNDSNTFLELQGISSEGKLRKLRLEKQSARMFLDVLGKCIEKIEQRTSFHKDLIKLSSSLGFDGMGFIRNVIFPGRDNPEELETANSVYSTVTNFISEDPDLGRVEKHDSLSYIKIFDGNNDEPLVVYFVRKEKDIERVKSMTLVNRTGSVSIPLKDDGVDIGELFDSIRHSADGYCFAGLSSLSGGVPYSSYFHHSLSYSDTEGKTLFKIIKSTKCFTDDISFFPSNELAEFLECCYSDIRKL